jgi:hypothetical protein
VKRSVPLLIVFVIGTFLLASYFFDFTLPGTSITLKQGASTVNNWGVIITAFAVGLASINLLRIHGAKIINQRSGWINSAILILTMFVFIIVGIYSRSNPDNEAAARLFSNLFNYAYSPFSATMYSMIAFYVASASYRAFRMRSLEATLLLSAAVLVMLGNAPIAEQVWAQFPVIGKWLLTVINTTGQRGIAIGVAIGGFATSLRILLGFDRGHLGQGD